MKKTLRFIGILLFSLCYAFAIGQKKQAITGFFVTTQNDSISCIFKDRNWKKQPSEFSIISNSGTVLHTQNISEVNIISRSLKYVTRTIKMARYVDNIQNANNNIYPEFDSATQVFVKLLYEGTLNLYIYFDKLDQKHFFIENKDNFLELYLHLFSGIGGPLGNQPIAIQNRQYEFVLKTLMTPCRSMFSIIENIRLEEEQLVQLFKLYDKCLESK